MTTTLTAEERRLLLDANEDLAEMYEKHLIENSKEDTDEELLAFCQEFEQMIMDSVFRS